MTGKDSTHAKLKGFDLRLAAFSILFGAVFLWARIIVDDAVNIQWVGSTVADAWRWSIESYYRWSSRLFIYFISSIVLQKGVIALAVYMAISAYVLLKALTLLFPMAGEREGFLFLIAVVMLFPFETQHNAGWIATLTSYFGPHAFAVMSLVPVKKALAGERIGWAEFVFYAVSLIYGANVEQMSIVALAVFSVVNVWLIAKKRGNAMLLILLLLAAASVVNIFVCPGNRNRNAVEEAIRFPTYGMLDMVDKADIGVSTTLKWLFTENALIVFFCGVLAALVWARYRDALFRTIAFIPAAAAVLFGPLRGVTEALFPSLIKIAEDVDYYGAFTVAAQGRGVGMIQFAAFLLLSLCVMLEVVLLNDSMAGLLVDSTLLMAGFASRAAMGFSPTVYASSTRTFTTLMFCVMIVLIHLYSLNCERLDRCGTGMDAGRRKLIYSALAVLGFGNLVVLVATV